MILGIETSCDETSVAVLKDGRELAVNLVSSQVDLHRRWGGVAPEAAARCHVDTLAPLLRQAMEESNLTTEDGSPDFRRLEAIAVTNRPGLIGALLVGVSAAKALSLIHRLPLLGINHLEAHLYAGFHEEPDLEFPLIGLVVSGGHSDLALMTAHGRFELLGRTVDDAPGEAFDKAARAMGLGYPGGPVIDRLAADGDPAAFAFPRANMGETFDFSFSGLKTALLRHLSAHPEARKEDVAASFQEAIVDALVVTTRRAVTATGVRTVIVAGGVAANRRLRRNFEEAAERHEFRVVIPRPSLCTDNAAMVAVAGYHYLHAGIDSGRTNSVTGGSGGLTLDTAATAPLGS